MSPAQQAWGWMSAFSKLFPSGVTQKTLFSRKNRWPVFWIFPISYGDCLAVKRRRNSSSRRGTSTLGLVIHPPRQSKTSPRVPPSRAALRVRSWATTGQRTDPVGLYQQMAGMTYKALLDAGVPEPQARLGATNPDVQKAITAKMFPTYVPKNIGNTTGSNPATGRIHAAIYRRRIQDGCTWRSAERHLSGYTASRRRNATT